MQIVVLNSATGDDVAHIQKLSAELGRERVTREARYWSGSFECFSFAWERHTEFATYTFVTQKQASEWFDPQVFHAAITWLGDLPGEVIRASLIAFQSSAGADPTDAELARSFSADDLITCELVGSRARVWGDFRLHPDGFGRLLIVDRGLVGAEPAQLVQRLQELGNYRKMALLGLPVAQRLTPSVTDLEERLSRLTRMIASAEAGDETLLNALSDLSAELAQMRSQSHYRMSASHAYAELCSDRVRQLNIQPVPGHRSLADFTERRLLPAVRTCEAFSKRLEDLSARTAWTSALLRTRVDTALSRQNRDLLASMNRRTQLQLRLQQTVEGLSVAAVSYYLVGLIGYLAKSLHELLPTLQPHLVTGASVPIVASGVWLAIRRLRRIVHG